MLCCGAVLAFGECWELAGSLPMSVTSSSQTWQRNIPPEATRGWGTEGIETNYYKCVLSHSVMSDSLRPHGLKPARLRCPCGFSRQEYKIDRYGLPFPPPGDLPNPGIRPAALRSPALASGFFTSSPTREAHVYTHRNTHTHTHTYITPREKIQGINKIIFGHKRILGNFPGTPAVKILSFHCRRHGFDPWLENLNSVSHKGWPKKN